MRATISAAGTRPTVLQPPAGLTGPTPFSFLSPISTPSQVALTPSHRKPGPLEAPYHHLALREIVKAWQVRLDRQGHLKLAHDAAVAREGQPRSRVQLLSTNRSSSPKRVYTGEGNQFPPLGWVPLLKPSSPPLQPAARAPSRTSLPPAGPQDQGQDSSGGSPQERFHLGWVGSSPSPTPGSGMR